MPGLDHPIKSVSTAFEILEILLELDGAGVAEVARAVDRPKSTVHDYLRTLTGIGVAVGEDGQYRPSMRLLDVGMRARNQIDLYTLSCDELRRIADVTGESTSLMIKENSCGVLVGVEAGPKVDNIYIRNSHPGTCAELNTTAGGKAILSRLDTEEVDQIIDEHGLPAATANTITDREALLEELETIRSSGYAVDKEERILGMWGVAVPLSTPRTIGALSVYGPIGRVTMDRIQTELVDVLRESANVVKVNLNYS